jgi:biotin transport system substrate-specific component
MILSYAQSNQAVKSKINPWLLNSFKVLLGSFALALCAQITLRLPFTPVPLALAPHVALFLGAFLGRKVGTMAVIAYIVQGAIGLPVFSAGNCGLAYILGPTGGYLAGYVVATFVTGWLIEKSKRQLHATLSLVAGNLIIYACGLPVLSLFVGIKMSFMLGIVPFLIGDAIKIGFMHVLFKRLK